MVEAEVMDIQLSKDYGGARRDRPLKPEVGREEKGEGKGIECGANYEVEIGVHVV